MCSHVNTPCSVWVTVMHSLLGVAVWSGQVVSAGKETDRLASSVLNNNLTEFINGKITKDLHLLNKKAMAFI